MESYPSFPCSVLAKPQTYAGCNFPRPYPWPECSWDASHTREAAGWLDCLESTPIAYSAADMSDRRYNDGSCNDSAAPYRSFRSTSLGWSRSIGCRRWHCPRAATCHLCTDYVPNLSTSCFCRLWAERCNQECRMEYVMSRAVVRWLTDKGDVYQLIKLGEHVTREVVHPRMNHEAAVELTGRPRCRPLVRMLCKKVKSKTKC